MAEQAAVQVNPQWTAPGLDSTPEGKNFLALAARASAGNKSQLPVFDKPVKKETIDAVRSSVAMNEAAQLVMNSVLEEQTAITAGQDARAQAIAAKEKAAAQARFAQDDMLSQINAQALEAFNPAIAAQSARLAGVATQRAALDDKINANKAVGFMDDPLLWLGSQLENMTIIGQRNSLAVTENSLQNSMQSLQIAARNAAELQKSTLPIRTLEEKDAALAGIDDAVKKQQLENLWKLSEKKNETAVNLQSLGANKAAQLFQLDQAEYQRQLSKHQSIVDNIKNNQGAPMRELELMRAGDEMAYRFAFNNFERLAGLKPDTGYKTVMAQDAKTQQLLVEVAFTGEVRSKEQAEALARIANISGRGKNAGDNPMPDGIKELVEFQIAAGHEFEAGILTQGKIDYKDAQGKKVSFTRQDYEGMPVALQKLKEQEYTAHFFSKKVGEKAMSLSPAVLALNDTKFIERFPALQGFVNSTEPVTEDQLIMALGAANNGNISRTAADYAKLNQERLKAAGEVTLTRRAGFEPPTSLRAAATIDIGRFPEGGVGFHNTRLQQHFFVVSNQAEVERMLRLKYGKEIK